MENKNLKVSLIVNVYKDIQSLSLIINALQRQTYKNFELIISEDGESDEMKNFISSLNINFSVKHTTQEDIGVRKAQSQNNGIRASNGEYLIFIDGDCIPYSTLIESHVILAERGCVLSGRRVNLPEKITKQIKNNQLDPYAIEKNIFFYPSLMFDKSTRFEQGIYINPNSWLYKKFVESRTRNVNIIGCHFSCWRDDMIAINGFDEDYGTSGVSDDVDLDWRFRAYGLKLKSCKNAANMFHLWHPVYNRENIDFYYQRMYENQKDNRFVCKLGINS